MEATFILVASSAAKAEPTLPSLSTVLFQILALGAGLQLSEGACTMLDWPVARMTIGGAVPERMAPVARSTTRASFHVEPSGLTLMWKSSSPVRPYSARPE